MNMINDSNNNFENWWHASAPAIFGPLYWPKSSVLDQRTSCILSKGRPLDSTGHPVGFYWMSTRILQVCFKWLRIANFIEKCNKKFYWMSSRNSIGHTLESTGRPVELVYWMSPRAEDLADCSMRVKNLDPHWGELAGKKHKINQKKENEDSKSNLHFETSPIFKGVKTCRCCSKVGKC